MNLCTELTIFIIKYAKIPSLSWQKLLGVESISFLSKNYKVLNYLYDKKFATKDPNNLFDDLLSTLTTVSYSIISTKMLETFKKANENLKSLLDQSNIYTEDVVVPVFNNLNLLKVVIEAYTNWNESYIKILSDNNIKLGDVYRSFDEEQAKVQEFVSYKYEIPKNSMTALIVYSNDDSVTQSFLNIFLKYINIFGSIGNSVARDSYLSDLCKLAIPNNLENTLEMKDKNLLISKFLFNIAYCYQILEYTSWVLLLEAMQKIYYLLLNSNVHSTKQSEEFDIDVLIKNLEENIKKYYPQNFDFTKSVLRNKTSTPGEDFNKNVESSPIKNSPKVTGRESEDNYGSQKSVPKIDVVNSPSHFMKTEEIDIKKSQGGIGGFFSSIKSKY